MDSKVKKEKKIIYDLNVKNGRINWNEDDTYPYPSKMALIEYEQHKHELQIELLKMQSWVKATNQRIVILFEGRDARR